MTQLQTPPGLGTYWQWREQSIYYVRSGEARRAPLLFIHGFGASTDHWRKNITGLEKDFEVGAIDLLGFGRSACESEKKPGFCLRNLVSMWGFMARSIA
jgi:pimeloyl-ACP methyl ester carboxylesterase